MVKASVVILNWNGEAMLRKYIPGLYESLRQYMNMKGEQEILEKEPDEDCKADATAMKAADAEPLAVPVAEVPVEKVPEAEIPCAEHIRSSEQDSVAVSEAGMPQDPSLFPEQDVVISVEAEPNREFEANLFSEIDPSFIGYPSQNEISATLAETRTRTRLRARKSRGDSNKPGEAKAEAAVREHRVARAKISGIQDEPQMVDETETSDDEPLEQAVSGLESQPEELIMDVGLADLLRKKEEERAADIKARMESLRQRTMAVKEANLVRKQLESKVYDARYELVVADNGSTDGSVAWLKENYPDIRLIEFDRNYGFAAGYNKALQEIDAEYFVLLNSDVRVAPGWLDTLIDFLETHQRAAICMPKILKEHDGAIAVKKDTFEHAGACGGFIDRFGFPFCRGRVLKYTEVDENQYDTPMEVFWASGAAMCVRSSVWKELGGLDARFFAHMEEIDFCWRAKLMGHEVWAVPAAKVYHVGGATLSNGSPYKLYLNYRNNLLMLHKNLPPEGKKDLIFFRMLLDGASAAIYLLTGRKELYRSVLKAHRDFKEMRLEFETSPRSRAYSNIPFNKLYGVFNGSIVLSCFLGRRRFSKLRQFS